ncbi:MAG: ABC transporter permease, partial [Methylobacteriaceae bacterium]|nr:ABC transporter permease [Methylobacteriaceae bacterium]
NPKAVKALADSYFEALDMIAKDPKKSNEIMGADVKQTGEEFAASAKYLKWVDREGSRKFFAGEFDDFNKAAAKLLLEAGVLKTMPDLNLADTRFLQ